MKAASLFALALAGALLLLAQSINPRPALGKIRDIEAVAIPSSATAAIAEDFWAEQIVLSNTHGSSVACTVTDNQGSPLALVPGGAIPNGAVWSIPLKSTKLLGGMRWSCATAGVVIGRAWGYVR